MEAAAADEGAGSVTQGSAEDCRGTGREGDGAEAVSSSMCFPWDTSNAMFVECSIFSWLFTYLLMFLSMQAAD